MIRNLSRLAEAQIQAAERRGDLKNLPGEGKPAVVDDLEGLDETQRIEALLARSTGSAGLEIALLKELEDLRARYDASPNDADLREELRKKATRLSIVFEQRAKPLLARRASDLAP